MISKLVDERCRIQSPDALVDPTIRNFLFLFLILAWASRGGHTLIVRGLSGWQLVLHTNTPLWSLGSNRSEVLFKTCSKNNLPSSKMISYCDTFELIILCEHHLFLNIQRVEVEVYFFLPQTMKFGIARYNKMMIWNKIFLLFYTYIWMFVLERIWNTIFLWTSMNFSSEISSYLKIILHEQ